jgi:hypothetical protein
VNEIVPFDYGDHEVRTVQIEGLPWYADHANLIILTDYMANCGDYSASDVAEAVRKPWQYRDEFDLARLGDPS